MPLSDGGPGLLEAIHLALGGRWCSLKVSGPLGKSVRARWLQLGPRKAVVESAQAIGLSLLAESRRDALRAHSFGLGQLLLELKKRGIREVWLGLGGSACTDGGTGMARALGWKFLDSHDRELTLGGGNLQMLARVIAPGRSALRDLKIRVLCDVNNPLYGKRGAAWVYGPQKGASPAQVRRLDAGLKRLGSHFGPRISRRPGAGAAGGLGAGLMAFAGAELVPGARSLMLLLGFMQKLKACDWVISGEGRLDAQSAAGKLPIEIAKAAKKSGKSCWLLVGSAARPAGYWKHYGVTRLSAISVSGMNLGHVMAEAEKLAKFHAKQFALQIASK